MNDLALIHPSNLPAIVVAACPRARLRFLEFFASSLSDLGGGSWHIIW
jgi:hypothetical protein